MLRRGAEWLTQAPNRTITFRIEGNCDPRGTEEYNIGLGERRAQAAKEFLTSLGVEALEDSDRELRERARLGIKRRITEPVALLGARSGETISFT